MASIQQINKKQEDDDDEDLEALRLAALATLHKKVIKQTQPLGNYYKPHCANPNLIAITPIGEKPVVQNRCQPVFKRPLHPPPRQRHPNQRPKFSNLTVLPQAQVEPVVPQPTSRTEETKEVTTKFSRFEDSESESEDESDTEKKESESSDESDDVLALDDDDDSLEALMAKMEHEIEEGIDPKPNKKEKKKSKTGKDKVVKEKSDKTKPDAKTAVIEPTLKENVEVEESVEVKVVKFDENTMTLNPTKIAQEKAKSPVRIAPLKESNKTDKNTPNEKSSPNRRRSRSPQNQGSTSPNFIPRARSPDNARLHRGRSPLRQRSISPRRSPVRAVSPRVRSPARRSPLKNSPDRYYAKDRSPPYKPRAYSPRRSRSPVRRSHSPRPIARDLSPRAYRRRSRSPWSPGYRSPPPRYRSRSPVRRRSLSPRGKRYAKSPPAYWSPKNSPSRSPARKDYSPRRRVASPRREFSYRRKSTSPVRKASPGYKRYSPPRSPKTKQRSLSPRRALSPRRRSPVVHRARQQRSRSRSPSLSLSPSPQRQTKDARRYKSPLRQRNEANEVANNRPRMRRNQSPVTKTNNDNNKDRKKPKKDWGREREPRQWERKTDDKRKERNEKTDKDRRSEREITNSKPKQEEEKEEETTLRVTDNPVFEARRKKFESKGVVEPVSKKIKLVSKRESPVNEEKVKIERKVTTEKEKVRVEQNEVPDVEETKIEDTVEQTEDFSSGRAEVDEIDSFLNEDVLDLSAEVWSSDDDLFPKVKKPQPKVQKSKPAVAAPVVEKKVPVKEKVESSKSKVTMRVKPTESKPVVKRVVSPEPPVRVTKPKAVSPELPTRVSKRAAVVSPEPVRVRKPSPDQDSELDSDSEPEIKKERVTDDSDLRAELSRRREERLTKAGSLGEKLPARLLQSAFAGAKLLGKKKYKKDEETRKGEKIVKKSKKKREASPPMLKEKMDGRRVLVLKRPAPVKMQSAHINVTFPKDASSESESSYSSSTSEDERFSPRHKRKVPIYMRLGTAKTNTSTGKRKVKLPSRRNKV